MVGIYIVRELTHPESQSSGEIESSDVCISAISPMGGDTENECHSEISRTDSQTFFQVTSMD